MPNKPSETSVIETKYQRAQALMQGYWTRNIAPNSTVYPIWIEGSDCFWYERDINAVQNEIDNSESFPKWDKEYRLVNAAQATNTLAFDHAALATALAEIIEQIVDKNCLPITDVKMQLESLAESDRQSTFRQIEEMSFTAFDKRWVFKPQSGGLTEVPVEIQSKEKLLSPDGNSVIFTRDYNLWLQDLATGEERALTRDGEELYCYSVVGNGWGYETDSASGLQARWSTDSKRIITVQRDSRQVLTQPIVEHVPVDGSIRPKVRYVRKSMQSDDHVPEYRLVAIDVETVKVQAANYPHIPIVRNSTGFFSSNMGWWGTDSRHAYFVDLARDYKRVSVVEFDTHNGATRILFEETSDTHINLMLNADDFPTFVPLPQSNELVWFSERSGWAHLYLYDFNTGALKHPITSGEWVVRDVVSIDIARRELFIKTAGRTAGRDPHYSDLARVNLDTGELITLSGGDYDIATISAFHLDINTNLAKVVGQRDIAATRSVSHSGHFAVVTRSRANSAPVSVLVDRNGQEILDIETADLSPLYAAVSNDWQWPEPVSLKAADGETDIYGLVYRPADFSSEQSYPVVAHMFNSPELPWVPKGSFNNEVWYGMAYFEAAALAELGFIVIQIDGRGTPYRSKAFQDESYGWVESANNLDDHVAGLQQLGERYPYMDLERVGIFSLNGGTGAVQGLLHYPDIYTVGVNGMCHDSRLFPASMWSDKYEGVNGPEPEHRYPEEFAGKLQGKLMLCHGMLDVSTPPANTFRIVEALQKANKEFDLLLLPNLGHGKTSYLIRRSWDYLVRHLQGVEPPKDFQLISARDL